MTQKAIARTSATIGEEIERRNQRRAELVARSEQVGVALEKERDAYSQSIAEGKDASAPAAIRELSDEQDGLGRALTLIDRELVALEGDKRSAAIEEARAKAADAENVALELSKKIHTLIDDFGNVQLIPLVNRFDFALREARTAEKYYNSVRGEVVEGWNSSVEKNVGNPSAKARTLARVVRAYVEGKSLPVASAEIPPAAGHTESNMALQ
jgi:hypothetical protein